MHRCEVYSRNAHDGRTLEREIILPNLKGMPKVFSLRSVDGIAIVNTCLRIYISCIAMKGWEKKNATQRRIFIPIRTQYREMHEHGCSWLSKVWRMWLQCICNIHMPQNYDLPKYLPYRKNRKFNVHEINIKRGCMQMTICRMYCKRGSTTEFKYYFLSILIFSIHWKSMVNKSELWKKEKKILWRAKIMTQNEEKTIVFFFQFGLLQFLVRGIYVTFGTDCVKADRWWIVNSM